MRKNIFNSAYVGPTGKHLSCLTETSMFGEYSADKQMSIHPRVFRGGRKVNTSKPRNPMRKGYLAKTSAELDRRRRDHASAKDAAAYRQPGSMSR